MTAHFCWNRDIFLLERFLVFATTSETPFLLLKLFFYEHGGGSRRRRRTETATAGGAATTNPMLEPADEELQTAEAESLRVAVLQSRRPRGERRQVGSAAVLQWEDEARR